MILVRTNHRELSTESKSTKLSIIRFCTKLVSALDAREGMFLYLIALLE